MHAFFERLNRRLAAPLDLAPRLMLLVAALLLTAIFFLPLWNLTMFAPQYPDGLTLDIYSYKLEGGNRGQDIKEINILNHYIGMRDLVEEDFTEFKWLPFVVGALALLYLRAAVVGAVGGVLDVLVLNMYFSAFALWSFAHRLYQYGHTLAPTAAVKVAPFMPPVFGSKQLANFTVYSYPGPASWAMAASTVLVLVAMYLAWRASRAGLASNVAAPAGAPA
jgi:copper chaperone NosL